MKIYIALLCLTISITLNAAQMAKVLTSDQQRASRMMFQLILDDDITNLKRLLQQYPEIVNEMPDVSLSFENILSTGTTGWGKNIKSALHFAVEKNNCDVACLLLEYKANPDIQNINKQTPLMWALIRAPSKYLDFVKSLIEAGADKEIKDSREFTVFKIATTFASFTSRQSNYESAISQYSKAISDGEAERDRYAAEKQLALQKILDAIAIKNLASIVHGYAYGVLPKDLPKSGDEKKETEKKGWFESYCAIQ